MEFIEYISNRLENNGYRIKQKSYGDVFISQQSSGSPKAWICYLTDALTPEEIRRCFDYDGHVLFVVKESLIPQEIASRTETSMWLRVLHGLYMGRIYVWNDRHLFGLHFDYDTGDVSESGIIQPDELLLVETGTWLRGWSGMYKLARFYDKQWWAETSSEQWHKDNDRWRKQTHWDTPPKQESDARTEYEQARDHYWQQQRAREQYQWKYDGLGDPPPKQASSAPDFMREFARAGSPSAVKALYRELAKKFHPDLNPGVDTTVEMQAVNAAYERYRL